MLQHAALHDATRSVAARTVAATQCCSTQCCNMQRCSVSHAARDSHRATPSNRRAACNAHHASHVRASGWRGTAHSGHPIQCIALRSAAPPANSTSPPIPIAVPFPCGRAGAHGTPGTLGTPDARGIRIDRIAVPRPHLHRDWAHPDHICTGTGLTPLVLTARMQRPHARALRHTCGALEAREPTAAAGTRALEYPMWVPSWTP